MTITEQARKDLYDSLEHVHGKEVATTLMEHLPPVGWADVARQHDITRLETRFDRLETRIDRLDSRLERVEGRFVDVSRDTRAWALSIMSLNTVMTAAAIALSRL